MYEHIDSFLDIIANANQYWCTIEGDPFVNSKFIVNFNTIDDNNYLNELTVPCPTDPEYWDGCFNFNDSTVTTSLVFSY